jgi:hypothetical protein
MLTGTSTSTGRRLTVPATAAAIGPAMAAATGLGPEAVIALVAAVIAPAAAMAAATEAAEAIGEAAATAAERIRSGGAPRSVFLIVAPSARAL